MRERARWHVDRTRERAEAARGVGARSPSGRTVTGVRGPDALARLDYRPLDELREE